MMTTERIVIVLNNAAPPCFAWRALQWIMSQKLIKGTEA